MARVLKEPEERKNEIMDAAQNLFESKGYEETSVNDIIQKVGIAKGTFYYYFKSKEEIMDAVVDREMDIQLQHIMKIIDDKSCNALIKLKNIIRDNVKRYSRRIELLGYLHKKENIVMHQKSLVQSVKKFAPVLSKIIQQGIDEKLFNTRYPLEVTEFLLVGMNFMFDPSIFSWSNEEYATRMEAFAEVLENTLIVQKGEFSFLNLLANQMYGVNQCKVWGSDIG
ncbi:MAG: TetR family transcriptional regulator [Firmicutes bacterium]|nr:TetR family transcriptional regulator [Bacillota bacterium]